MKIQNTTLRINTDPTTIYSGTVDLDTANTVYSILIWRNRVPHADFSDFKNLTATDNLIIEYQDTDGNIRDIQLPETIHNGLIQYFQNSPDIHSSTDCFGFLVEIFWWKRGNRLLGDGKFEYLWEKIYSSVSQLQSGDILVFRDVTKEWLEQGNYHCAMYIWNELFISKGWFGWIIFVADIDQLKTLNPEYRCIVQLLREKL